MKPVFTCLPVSLVRKIALPALLAGFVLTLGPSTPACGPVVGPISCPVNGLGKDFGGQGCTGGYCSRQTSVKSPALEYKGAKVYFCCSMCINIFKKSPEKFAANANHQLVSTFQAMQMKCPLCGGDCKNGVTATIAGVQVSVCNAECKKKLDQVKPAQQLQMVFGDTGFAKGFKVFATAAPPKTGASTSTAAGSCCETVAVQGGCCCQKQAAQTVRVQRN